MANLLNLDMSRAVPKMYGSTTRVPDGFTFLNKFKMIELTEEEKQIVLNENDDWTQQGCSEKSPDGFHCTRAKGHEGEHIATGGKKVMHIWDSCAGIEEGSNA